LASRPSYLDRLCLGPQINFYPNLVDERFSSNFICLGFGYNRRHVHHSLGLLSSTGNEGDYFWRIGKLKKVERISKMPK
jgi:hypothetical protein